MKKFLCLLSPSGALLGGIITLMPYRALADACTNAGGVDVSGALGVGNCVGGNGINPIFALITIAVKFATGVLGLIMVLMIVIAGLQYVVSNGSPDTVRSAKERITSVATGFILFVLMYGILQILLPPGSGVF
jgi:type IV secretion system pilin